jgi:hypothetical protein
VSDAPGNISRRNWRPRISLLSVLLLTTIVALAIVIALFWREVGPLRAEARQLRNEVGKLTIDDPTKVAAIQFHRRDDNLWRWRVWIPAGHSYRLRWVEAAIPCTDFPAVADFTRTLSGSGENVVSYRIDGKGWSTLDAFGEIVQGKQHNWNWAGGLSEEEGIGDSTETYDPEEPIVLTRQRDISSFIARPVNTDDPADGFMIWLEPVK